MSPLTLLEAQLMKIPVIATDVGGISEIIKNKKTGILIPPEEPQKMLKAINELLVNDSLMKILQNNGFELITQNFSWEKLLPKYIELYEK